MFPCDFSLACDGCSWWSHSLAVCVHGCPLCEQVGTHSPRDIMFHVQHHMGVAAQLFSRHTEATSARGLPSVRAHHMWHASPTEPGLFLTLPHLYRLHSPYLPPIHIHFSHHALEFLVGCPCLCRCVYLHTLLACTFRFFSV